MTARNKNVLVLKGENIAAYGFGKEHPFGPDRHDVFHAELQRRGIADAVELRAAGSATREELLAFHTSAFVDMVESRCHTGEGFLDGGDTPAQQGLAEAAAAVVGAAIDAMESVMAGSVAPRIRAHRRAASRRPRACGGLLCFQ